MPGDKPEDMTGFAFILMQLIRGPVDGKQVAFEIFPFSSSVTVKKKMIVDQLDINGACAHSVSFDGSNLRYLLAFKSAL